MARKKEASPPKLKLTHELLDVLAKRLVGTTHNVYHELIAVVGLNQSESAVATGDEIFELLEKVGRIFKCEECGLWLSIDQRDRSIEGMCTSCVDDIDE